MNAFAQTLLHQANEAIEAGANAKAMDLLRQARAIAGNDNALAHQILARMVQIAPACNCEAEAAVWRRQLVRSSEASDHPVAESARKPPAAGLRRSRRTVAVVLATIAALTLAGFAFQYFWSYSRARFNPATTRPAADAAPESQPA